MSNRLRSDLLWISVILLISLAVAFGPGLLTVNAAGGGGDTECVLWADIKPWALTRCESWESGEICMIATSGMFSCWKE